MTRPLASPWLTLLIALALILGAVAPAAALPSADRGPLHEVGICAEGHEDVVRIDADGGPVEQDAACPDPGCAECPRQPGEFGPLHAVAIADRSALERRAEGAEGQNIVSIHLPRPWARGPPEKV